MKKLAFVFLMGVSITGCTGSIADSEPQRTAIAAHLKKELNDPASYEGVRWGAPVHFTRQDSAAAAASKLSSEYTATEEQGRTSRRTYLIHTAIKLENVTDTTRVGVRLTHAYRAKNKLGAVVLDSAQFVVYSGGKVEQL
jgi:hypothetical protein